MNINDSIKEFYGEHVTITGRRPVYGGDINDSYQLSLSDGSKLFMKCNSVSNISFFESEIKGLKALKKTGAIGVPRAICCGIDKDMNRSYLLMEFIEAAPRIKDYWEVFGRELAAMHDYEFMFHDSKVADNRKRYGFDSDNFIGATIQKNTPKDSWVAFFRDLRLAPQIDMAQYYLSETDNKKFIKLLDHLDSYLVEPDKPSLIHGDLWSGNAVCGPDGKAWILDPAAYVGHYEAELAMTELFGGFHPSFYRAYNEIKRIDPGYNDRRDLYNLYHLLNHLNLFGGSYLHSVRRILGRYSV